MTVSLLQHAYPAPGDLVDGKYEIRRVLGAGAMGAVLEAVHILRKARVALKFMSPRLIEVPGVVERFFNEGVAASRINNDHVVSVLDVSQLPNGLPYLVMEYLDGEDLEGLLEREGNPGLTDISRSVYFVLQILRGLQAAHQVGIIHRDLKPANCFVVAKDGEPDFIKLVDFGISKVKQDESEQLNLTLVGSTLGTPLYVSPEQARNAANVDARGDLYSAAVMLYELISGRAPFESESGQLSELFMLLATATPDPLDSLRGDVPAELALAVAKGLAKSADDRYQSAAEMAQSLAPFADARSDVVLKQLVARPSRIGSRPPPELQKQTAIAYPSSARPLPLNGTRVVQSTALSEAPQSHATAALGAAAPGPAPLGTAPGLGVSANERPHRRRVPLALGVSLGAGALLFALALVGVWSGWFGGSAAPPEQHALPVPEAAVAPAAQAPTPELAAPVTPEPAPAAGSESEPPEAAAPATPAAPGAATKKPAKGGPRKAPSLSKIRIED